jgi:hypothetical protein
MPTLLLPSSQNQALLDSGQTKFSYRVLVTPRYSTAMFARKQCKSAYSLFAENILHRYGDAFRPASCD